MDTREIHACIQGPDLTAVTKWIESVVAVIEGIETFDRTKEIGRISQFHGKYDLLILEQVVDSEWLELTVRPRARDSVCTEWDNIRFGERLVDDRGGALGAGDGREPVLLNQSFGRGVPPKSCTTLTCVYCDSLGRSIHYPRPSAGVEDEMDWKEPAPLAFPLG